MSDKRLCPFGFIATKFNSYNFLNLVAAVAVDRKQMNRKQNTTDKMKIKETNIVFAFDADKKALECIVDCERARPHAC